MPRSRTRSPETKSSSRHYSQSTSKRSDNYRHRSRHSRSPAKARKSRHHSPPTSSSTAAHSKDRPSARRSRSPSGHKHSSSKANKNYSSNSGSSRRRRSRSRESPKHHRNSHRTESSKEHYRSSRRRDDSSSSSSSSRSTSHSSSSTSTSRSSRRSRSSTRSSTSRQKSTAAAFIPLTANKGSHRRLSIKNPTSNKQIPVLHRPFGIRPGLTKSMFLLTLDKSQTNPTGPATFASVQQLNDEPILPETLAQINANGFVSKSFVSSATGSGKAPKANKITSEKVLINLDAETMSVPLHAAVEAVDPVFNPTVRAILQ